MNKSTLLSQLQIDRQGEGPRGSDRPFPWLAVLGGIVALVAVATLIWFLVVRPDHPAVHVAGAKPVTSGPSTGGGSLLDASGYVVARRAATVSSKVTGKVAEVLIEEGQHVSEGQVMARLDDSNARAALVQSEAQVAAAQSNLDLAKLAFDQAGPKTARQQKLAASGFASDTAVEDARNVLDSARVGVAVAQRQVAVALASRDFAKRNLDDTVIRAPFAGVVTVKAAQPGEMVSPVSAGGGFTRTGIGTIVDMDSLEVQVDVAESFINRVRQGMPATVKLNAYPDWEIPAEVIAVIPTADRSKATISVRVGLKAKDARLAPEMGARVSFLAPKEAAAAGPAPRSVIVPADAVITDGPDKGVVFVVSDGRLERRAVRLGPAEKDGQVLQAGVRPGETLAVGELGKLKDGQQVRIDRKPIEDKSDDN
jgi:RND family efflux transporter MFP subunit